MVFKLTKTVFLALAICQVSCSSKQKDEGLPFYNSPDFTPHWISSSDEAYSSIHKIAPFRFTNQNGVAITNKNVEGKIYVANFFFSRCGSICPKMNSNLHKVAAAFTDKNNVLILSHSVTPEEDSVQHLKQFAERNNIDSKNWWLLTGDKEAIYTLARKSYFADEETGYQLTSRDFLHTENALLVDREGRIRGVYNATLELEINKLIEHINLLLKEVSIPDPSR